MIPLGYLYKHVVRVPEWLKASSVNDVFSVSNCISKYFAIYYDWNKHNGYGVFNSPTLMQTLAHEHNVDLTGTTLFYYETYEKQYDNWKKSWVPFYPCGAVAVDSTMAGEKQLAGFDVVTYSYFPECSPLSCNRLADIISVNEHCLLRTFDEAKELIEKNAFNSGSKRGPYNILAVYTIGPVVTQIKVSTESERAEGNYPWRPHKLPLLYGSGGLPTDYLAYMDSIRGDQSVGRSTLFDEPRDTAKSLHHGDDRFPHCIHIGDICAPDVLHVMLMYYYPRTSQGKEVWQYIITGESEADVAAEFTTFEDLLKYLKTA